MEFSLDNLFDEQKAAEVKNATEKSSTFVRWDEDPRFIQFKVGNTYQFRLLYYVKDPNERKTPFISKYTHNHWDEDAEHDKLKTITCPTSEYVLYNNGFNKCPVCKATRKFYKDAKDGSDTADELYSQYRRKFHGYALVYVVNDPTNEENNGTVKLMHFGITIQKWFKLQIFGIDEKGKLVDDETIGKDAFKTEGGFNLKISVTKKGEYNDYLCEFARKSSDIDLSAEQIAEAAEELKFDEEFCTRTEQEGLDKFYKEYVLAEEVSKDSKDEFSLDLGAEGEDEIPMDYEKTEKVEEKPKAAKKADKVPEKTEEVKKEAKVEDSSGDIDIDNILSKVKKSK